MARRKTKPKPINEPGDTPTQSQLEKGSYERKFVTHVETNTKSMAHFHDDLPSSVRSWAKKGCPGFERPALDAIRRCVLLWEARPLLGKVCASYEDTARGGTSFPEERVLKALDRADEMASYQARFHPAHWSVFEAVVRFDRPVSSAANQIENNAPQSTASSRAIVGLIANVIAMEMRA